MRPRLLYLIVDGMTEPGVLTSLAQAQTPTMDNIAAVGRTGLYTPVTHPKHSEPKTDIVVPAFFGIPAPESPGRAALEMADQGLEILPGSLTILLRSGPALRRPKQLEVSLRTLARQHGFHLRESRAANSYRKWILSESRSPGSRTEADGAVMISEVEKSLRGIDACIEEVWEVPAASMAAEARARDVAFLGWAKGSLRGAFKLLGARCNPFNRPKGSFFAWKMYERNYHEWCKPLLRNPPSGIDTFVLYSKEAAFASRMGLRQAKIEAIEFMDRMLARLIADLEPSLVVIASDHSSEIGGTANPVENACYALGVPGQVGRSGPVLPFCEVEASQRCAGRAVAQAELVDLISRASGRCDGAPQGES